MKKILYSCLFLLFSQHAVGQELRKDQLKLVSYLIKECGYYSEQDSLRVVSAVKVICTTLKIRHIHIVKNKTGSSHCLPFGHMFINVSDNSSVCRGLVNEAPHAQQFAEQPIFYSVLFLKGFVNTIFGSLFLTKKEREKVKRLVNNGCSRFVARIWVAHERQEFILGTAENDAHNKRQKILEPQILRLLASN